MRRRWVAIMTVIAATSAASATYHSSGNAAAEYPAAIGAKRVNLKDQLEKGLRARRPAEFAYIARVIAMVDSGALPETLVRSTFGWARRKRPYPFPYSQRALRWRAAELGILVR